MTTISTGDMTVRSSPADPEGYVVWHAIEYGPDPAGGFESVPTGRDVTFVTDAGIAESTAMITTLARRRLQHPSAQ